MQGKFITIIVLLILVTGIVTAQDDNGAGLLLDKELYANSPTAAPLTRGDFINLPSSVSLREYAPSPGSQGKYGTCTGWAASYAARTMLEAMANGWDQTTIDENVFSPSYIYNQIRKTSGCMSGASLLDALDVLKNQGSVKLSEFSYDCNRSVTSEDKEKAAPYRIIEYRELFWGYAHNKTALTKKSLAENKPVVIAMRIPNSFNSAGKYWNPKPGEYSERLPGHALTVIGYDNDKYGGSFEILNSWGSYWGDKGYTWIPYRAYEQYCVFAYEVIDDTPAPVNEVDLSGEMIFTKFNEDEVPATFNGDYFTTDKSYNSGDIFRLLISNNEPAYVYAFGSDLSYKTTKIFPFTERMVAYLPYKKNHVAIPDEDHALQLDTSAGKTYLCFLYSKEELDIDAVMHAIETGDGTFWERLRVALGNRMVDKENIEYEFDEFVSFQARSSGKAVVPVVLEVGHE